MNIKDRVYNILTQEDVLNCMRMCDSGQQIDSKYLSETFKKMSDMLFDLVADKYEDKFREAYNMDNNKVNGLKQNEMNILINLTRKYTNTTNQSFKAYKDFYNNEILAVANKLSQTTREKLKPVNISGPFGFRFNEKISWDNENNLGVNMLAAIESGYFNTNIPIDMFNGQRKIQTYYNGVLPANFG